jgi:prepilin peptidase CpaA
MPRAIEVMLAMLVVVAAAHDLRSRHIPNWLTVSGAVVGFVLHCLYGGWSGAGASLAGAVLGLGMFIVFFLAGGMGAGDVKLFGAVGSFVGPQALVLVFVFTALLGGLTALGMVIWRRSLGGAMPYGVVIAGGTFVSLLVIH